MAKVIRCAERAGLKITAIEAMPGGGFRVLTTKSVEPDARNDLDQWKARRAR